MPDPRLVETVAGELGTRPDLVEKDWHVVRALGLIAKLDHGEVRPAFSGGTSLSKGYGLIKRFSEDIDFKVAMPSATSSAKARGQRSAYRTKVLDALLAEDFQLSGEVKVGNGSQFFSANLAYPSDFATGVGLRPHLRVEMTFHAPALPPVMHSIRSLLAQAQQQPPEVQTFPFVDLIETAADKLSALAWRVCTRQRGSDNDDPTVIRHLHDLAALESHVANAPIFKDILLDTVAGDANRGGGHAPADPTERFGMTLDLLQSDALWAAEYDEFVREVSFARVDEQISFAEALEATRRLVRGCT